MTAIEQSYAVTADTETIAVGINTVEKEVWTLFEIHRAPRGKKVRQRILGRFFSRGGVTKWIEQQAIDPEAVTWPAATE